MELPSIALFVGVALAFDFFNGFNDSANMVATVISTRAMAPARALAVIAVCEFIGPFLFGVAVARTISHEVIDPARVSNLLVFAALLAAIGWNLLTWRAGIPSSSSHALIGGLIGSAVVAELLTRIRAGAIHSAADLGAVFQVVQPRGITKVLFSLFLAPPLAFLVGYAAFTLIHWLCRLATPKVNRSFKRGQLLTSIGLALSHGTNDAQKTMGIIAMALYTSGLTRDGGVPRWVVAACAAAIALGTACGSWRLIRTIGGKFYKIRPIHGFTTQVGAASLILGASLLGCPVSTSHVVSSAVMGAGSAERMSKVRWGVGKQILLAWTITIPVTMLAAGLIYFAIWATPWAA